MASNRLLGPANDASSERVSVPSLWLAFGLGAAIGASAQGHRAEKSALDWAVAAARDCESTYSDNDHANVSECLEYARQQVEEERLQNAEPYDPEP